MKIKIVILKKRLFIGNVLGVLLLCSFVFLFIPRMGIYHTNDMNVIKYIAYTIILLVFISFFVHAKYDKKYENLVIFLRLLIWTVATIWCFIIFLLFCYRVLYCYKLYLLVKALSILLFLISMTPFAVIFLFRKKIYNEMIKSGKITFSPKIYRLGGEYPRILKNDEFITNMGKNIQKISVFLTLFASLFSSNIIYIMTHISNLSIILYGFLMCIFIWIINLSSSLPFIDFYVVNKMNSKQ
ncbi:hypothetical protein [Legionella fairfieldensis]|uniref:hypothetical protein n=1 Tax=Legionella fairfieldensis TaxID=45064 RepID=UPI00048D7A61|nr:hypothetical protein [Legionella fairfieldensis]